MLLLTAAFAAPPEELWVELPSAEARHTAMDAGFGWAEGQDGDWFRLLASTEAVETSGLRWRRDALDFEGWSPTVEDVDARLGALGSATLVQIGSSVEGRPILAARFGTGARALRVIGGHHGNEGSSIELALAVAEALDTGVVTLPAETEVWIVPAVNPDGLAANTRTNALGVDLNRNYGYEWRASEAGAGEYAFSEPETRAVRALSRARAFDAGLMLHSGAQNLGWVWNWTADVRPQEEWLLSALADNYAQDCSAPGFYITNGADWYVTHGDATDWSYGGWGTYDFTLELTSEKSPPEANVAEYTDWHLDAILAWLSQPADVTLVATDAHTGEPIPAWMASDSAALWSPTGALQRWGDGPWTIGAPGYTSDTDGSLTPETLLEVLPEPRLVSRGGGPVPLRMAGTSEAPLTLVQPGESTVTVPADGPGTWTIDPATLAPGAWTLITAEGVVPRALFIGEVDDRVTLEAAELDSSVLTLSGSGFAPGAEAWSIGGTARALRPLLKVAEDADTLVFSLSSADEDVLVWVNGAWLSALDIHGVALVDDTPPAERADEEAIDALPVEELRAVGACASARGGPAGLLLTAALLAGRRRRRRA